MAGDGGSETLVAGPSKIEAVVVCVVGPLVANLAHLSLPLLVRTNLHDGVSPKNYYYSKIFLKKKLKKIILQHFF